MKKRDDIEDLILKNIEALNDNEPMPGHFERFEAKLNAQKKKSKKFNFSVVWKVAAAVVFVLLATNQAFMYFSKDEKGMFASNNSSVTLASVSDEYKEVEYYYTSSINSGIDQWNRLVSEGKVSEDEQQMMNDELSEFEDMYKNLQKDLAANPNDDRVVSAMLEYYQAKLSVINIIIEKLKEVQQETADAEQNETQTL
jgi:hypothetical protein